MNRSAKWSGLLVVALVLGLAALAASGAAYVAHGSALIGTAHASESCTEYAGVDSENPCDGGFGSLCDCEYETGSEGLRDDNNIDMADSRFWVLSYPDTSVDDSGTGTFGSQGSSGGWSHAECIDDDSAVSGMCWTDWHT